MSAVNRIITRIQDQDDFAGALTDGLFLRFNSGTGKFSLQSPAEVLALTDLSDVTAKTGTGSVVVMQGSPTITTPTIGSFANAAHTHADAAGGGTIDHGVLTGLGDDDHPEVYVRFTIGATPPASPRTGDLWLVQ